MKNIRNSFLKGCFSLGIVLLFPYHFLAGDEFPWHPPKNFVLQHRYIALHHPVNTRQVLAQLYFDQGLTFIYAFNHDAAYWSFLRASEVDPDMAMAYWGMALAIGPNINMEITPERMKVAYDLVQKALEKSQNGPENERDYIQALSQRYSKEPEVDIKTLAENYSHAMEKVTNKYPDDPDAAVLFAESLLDINPWAQWSKGGKPLPGTMKAVRKLQSVLSQWPEHLGANHYFIHAIEASNHPEMALMSAERLKKLLPSSGHILHMPSHIYILVGDYEQAVRSNLAAVAADREYIREYGMTGIYPLHYLSHNLFFLSRAYVLQGRFEDAKQAAHELTSFYSSHFHKMKDLEYYISAPLTVLITFHRWKEILALPLPNENTRAIIALWHFARALAFANLGDLKSAHEEQGIFLDKKNQLSQKLNFGFNKVNNIMSIAELILEAGIAKAQGHLDQTLIALRKAVIFQNDLRYNEPADWFYPVRESLGAILFQMGKFQEAEEVFREELKKHPRNGRALFGLRETLKAQSKWVDSYWVNEEFQKAWRYSMTPLSMQEL